MTTNRSSRPCARLLEREGLSVVGVASTCADALRALRDVASRRRPRGHLRSARRAASKLARRLVEDGLGDGAAVILISTHAEADLADLIAASPAAGFLPEGGAVGGARSDGSRSTALARVEDT